MRSLLSGILNGFNLCLSRIELKFSRKLISEDLDLRPVFIIGAPRSGSTLLYQLMTDFFDVGYLTNLHCKFWGAASWVQRILSSVHLNNESSYTSKHGQTYGLMGPSECGAYWYRFFRRQPQYVALDDVDKKRMSEMYVALGSLNKAFGKPLLFKNMNCALRLEPLMETLPNATFIVISRNIVDNAQSLLHVRQRVHGSYETWWSMEPHNIEALKQLPVHEQVVEQIREIYKLIDASIQETSSDRFLHVSYEDLCNDPRQVLSKIRSWLNGRGVQLSEKGPIPEEFEISNVVKIPLDLYERIREYEKSTV